MELKEMLGDLYTPEIEEKLVGKKLVDLSTGNYVDKNKFENMVSKYNELNTEKVKVQEELDKINTSKMTEQEKDKAEITKLKESLQETNKRYNRAEIEKLYVSAGIKSEEYNALLENVGSDNLEQSKAMANSMINIITSRTATAEQRAKEKILKDTPDPINGSSNNSGVTLQQFKKMSYSDMIKFKEEQPDLFKQYINNK